MAKKKKATKRTKYGLEANRLGGGKTRVFYGSKPTRDKEYNRFKRLGATKGEFGYRKVTKRV